MHYNDTRGKYFFVKPKSITMKRFHKIRLMIKIDHINPTPTPVLRLLLQRRAKRSRRAQPALSRLLPCDLSDVSGCLRHAHRAYCSTTDLAAFPRRTASRSWTLSSRSASARRHSFTTCLWWTRRRWKRTLEYVAAKSDFGVRWGGGSEDKVTDGVEESGIKEGSRPRPNVDDQKPPRLTKEIKAHNCGQSQQEKRKHLLLVIEPGSPTWHTRILNTIVLRLWYYSWVQ